MIPGATIVRSLDDAILAAESAPDIYVIGGAEIWKQAISITDRLYITEIDIQIDDGDTFFPEWPVIKTEPILTGGHLVQFQETKREEMSSDQTTFRFLVLDRVNTSIHQL